MNEEDEEPFGNHLVFRPKRVANCRCQLQASVCDGQLLLCRQGARKRGLGCVGDAVVHVCITKMK